MLNKNFANEFLAEAEHWLVLFDKELALENVPISSRPLATAIRMVTREAIKIQGGSTKDFAQQEWFSVLVRTIRRWFESQYGTKALKSQKESLTGIVVFRGTPFKLNIPATISRVHIEGEQTWLIFPNGVHATERVDSFFENKPPLDSLSSQDRDQLEKQVRDVVLWTRSSNLALKDLPGLPESRRQMPPGTWSHIDKAVSDILTLCDETATAGCWDLHIAVEKAFKILLAQNGKMKSGHDLNALSKVAEEAGMLAVPAGLSQFPDWKTAAQYRYAEIAISVQEALKLYFAALEVIFQVTSKLKRGWSGTDVQLLLQRPGWVGPE